MRRKPRHTPRDGIEAQGALDEAIDRFKKASSENREIARSIIPPAQRLEDTDKFSVPPLSAAEG